MIADVSNITKFIQSIVECAIMISLNPFYQNLLLSITGTQFNKWTMRGGEVSRYILLFRLLHELCIGHFCVPICLSKCSVPGLFFFYYESFQTTTSQQRNVKISLSSIWWWPSYLSKMSPPPINPKPGLLALGLIKVYSLF